MDFLGKVTGAISGVGSKLPGVGGLFNRAVDSPGITSAVAQSRGGGKPPSSFNARLGAFGGGAGDAQFATGELDSEIDALKQQELDLQREMFDLRKRQMLAQPADIDIAKINRISRKRATAAVNPFYKGMIRRFKNNQKRKKGEAIATTERRKEALETELGQFLEDTGINRERTAEDVATNIGELDAQESFQQQQQGTEFDRARRALAGDVAGAGLGTSGLGQQAQAEATSDRAKLEKEQGRQFTAKRDQQKLFESRTFADLDKADVRKTEATATEKKELDINLDTFIKDLAFQTDKDVDQLEKTRLEELQRETSRQSALQFSKAISQIQDPFVRDATRAAFGGQF